MHLLSLSLSLFPITVIIGNRKRWISRSAFFVLNSVRAEGGGPCATKKPPASVLRLSWLSRWLTVNTMKLAMMVAIVQRFHIDLTRPLGALSFYVLVVSRYLPCA